MTLNLACMPSSSMSSSVQKQTHSKFCISLTSDEEKSLIRYASELGREIPFVFYNNEVFVSLKESLASINKSTLKTGYTSFLET